MHHNYRAWDITNEKMLIDSNFSIGMTDGLLRQNGVAGTIGGVILLRTTGLCDKHGREGFEGDIFKITNGRHYWIYEITTFPSISGSNLYAVCKEHNVSRNSDESMFTYEAMQVAVVTRDCISTLKNGTILGNIYENQTQAKETTK